MKSLQIILSLLFLNFVLLAMFSCEEDPKSPLAGDWSKVTQNRTCTLIISDDNKFETDFIDDTDNDVWGRITISGNQLTIIDEGGPYKSDVSGIYTFQVEGNTLTFVEEVDPEEGRRILIVGTWSK